MSHDELSKVFNIFFTEKNTKNTCFLDNMTANYTNAYETKDMPKFDTQFLVNLNL